MIRDITIGQYFPGKSAIHKMDPRIKILLSILYIVMLFVADNMWGLLLGVLFGALFTDVEITRSLVIGAAAIFAGMFLVIGNPRDIINLRNVSS